MNLIVLTKKKFRHTSPHSNFPMALSSVSYCKVKSYASSLSSLFNVLGDQWGEVDTRFSYCALSALSILGKLRSGIVDVDKAVDFIVRSSCTHISHLFDLLVAQ
jgi:hypothetical protein